MHKLKYQYLVILGFSILAGCGGGGGDGGGGGGASTAPSPSASTSLPFVASVPPATYANPQVLDAFNRINDIRRQTGLGLIAQNTSLDVAAINHANYLVENREFGHTETQGKPFYTSTDIGTRTSMAGYYGSSIIEVINFDLGLSGPKAVEQLMSTVYHRVPFVTYGITDVGLGRIVNPSVSDRGAFVMEFGTPQGTIGQMPPATPYVMWPPNGSTISQVEISEETPAPGGKGYSISLSINQGSVLNTKKFELLESGTTPVPAFLINADTDKNNLVGLKYAALSPKDQLKHLTSYTVVFEGTVDGKPVNLTWGFSTP